jgi:hypothetical protein
LLAFKIASNFGVDRDDTLPSEVPFLRREATDKLNDSSMFAICLNLSFA